MFAPTLKSLLATACIAFTPGIAVTLLPAVALAGAEEARVHARKGAESFKAGAFYEAAVEFEKAYGLDPQDFKNLRYAGRAWQEVGYWERALVLLERYHSLETDAKLKESVLEKLEPLRWATPRDKAEALDTATRKFAQAHLEAEAANAFESLADEASLRRAVTHLELARLGAPSEAEKQRLDGDIRRVRDKIEAAAKATIPAKVEPKVEPQVEAKVEPKVEAKVEPKVEAKVEPKVEPKVLPKVGAAVQPAPGNGLRISLFVAGGVLVAAGGAATFVGANQGADANQKYNDGRLAHETYLADKSSADTLWYAGVGALGVGAAMVVTGVLVGSGEPPKSEVVTLVPFLGRESAGMVLAGRF